MNEDARPAGTVVGMSTATEPATEPSATVLEDGRVRCACGAIVQPTRPGGTRPRPHLRIVEVPDAATGEMVEHTERCTIVHPTEVRCKRCGGTTHEPLGAWRVVGGELVHGDTLCRSPVFHPETWAGKRGERFGNAAAAGEVIGVSGEYFEYIRRRYPEGSASRPPEPVGIDMARRCLYWNLAEVEVFQGTRPGLPSATRTTVEEETPAEAAARRYREKRDAGQG